MAKKKAVMAVPPNWNAHDKRFGETVKEGLDVLMGHRGSPLDRAVTFKDLVDTNLVRIKSNASQSLLGTSSGFVPVTETGGIQAPPAPTSLTASGAFQNIILTWDLKNYVGHAFVEVFRHTSDSIADATLLARVSGFTGVFSDPTGPGASFYYWVRAVNVLDDIGPFNSSIGVNGTTQQDVAILLDLLEGEITSSELAQSLATPIESISGINALALSLETYTGYISSYNGNSLISRIEGSETTATAANTLAGNLETFTGYLSSYAGTSLLSRIGTAEGTVSGHTTSIGTINTSITTINNSISSLNTATSNLQSSLSDLSANTADVYIQATAPTGTIADNSRWYDTSDNNELHIYFDSDGNGTKEWVAVTDPRIESNEIAVADLETEVFNSDGSSRLATASAFSALNTTVINQGGSITSLTTDVTSLENEVFSSDGTSRLATASALSSTNTTVSTQGGNISTLQTDVTSLNGAVFNSDSSVKLATTSALNTLTSDVRAIYDGTEPSLVTSIQADVTELEGEVFNSDGSARLATGSAVSSLSSTVSGQAGSISTIQGDITNLQGAVFDSDGTVQLATTSTVSSLTSTVNTQGGNISTLQGDVTSLESEVFNDDGTSRLATGSALSSLSSSVSTQGGDISTLQGDVTSLESEVFDANGNGKLATTSALSSLTSDVEAIYDGTDSPSLVRTIQTDVTALDSEVFNNDGSSRLATSSALSGLSSTVSSQGGSISTLQTDVTDLEAQVFNDDGTARLATASALSGVSSSVSSNSGNISTIQSDITSLEAEVFNSDGTARLATGSALNSLSSDVEAIYDPTSDSTIVGSVQQNVTALEGAVFDANGAVQLASSTAVSLLNNEVWGNGVTPSGASSSRIDSLNSAITNPTTGLSALSGALSTLNTEVFPNGNASASRIDSLDTAVFDTNGNVKLASASAVSTLETEVFGTSGAAASRIDGLFAEVFNGDGTSRLATASALTTLNTEVNAEGAIADKVENIAASMFVNGNTEGTLNLATAANLNTVTAEVFPDGTSQASRIDQLSSAVFDASGAVQLASASVVSDISTEVFPNGTANASAIDTVQATVGGQSSSIETLQEVVGDETGGLSSQYSVKLDTAGHISGFGLSNTVNDGTPTSAFIVRADRFAIVNPSASNQQTNSPGNTSNLIVPFTVQSSATTINGESVPAGVYMDTAFIKSGSITNAFIGDAAIDDAKISNLSADKLNAGTINTSLLNIDSTTLTSGPNGELQVGSINANAITAGAIGANVMVGTEVYADNLVGDVAVLLPFRSTSGVSFRGSTASGGGTVVVTTQQLPATSHQTNGHKPFASITGWYDSTANKTYTFKLYMQNASGASNSVGAVSLAFSYSSTRWIRFTGDKRSLIVVGATLTSTGKSHTASTVYYDSSNNYTQVTYSLGSGAAFATGNVITASASSAYQLVGETRFKANTNLYAQFAVSGSLSAKTLGAVNMKLEVTRYGSSGTGDNDNSTASDIIHEVSGFIMGTR